MVFYDSVTTRILERCQISLISTLPCPIGCVSSLLSHQHIPRGERFTDGNRAELGTARIGWGECGKPPIPYFSGWRWRWRCRSQRRRRKQTQPTQPNQPAIRTRKDSRATQHNSLDQGPFPPKSLFARRQVRSRPSPPRARKRAEQGGMDGWIPNPRGPSHGPKNKTCPLWSFNFSIYPGTPRGDRRARPCPAQRVVRCYLLGVAVHHRVVVRTGSVGYFDYVVYQSFGGTQRRGLIGR